MCEKLSICAVYLPLPLKLDQIETILNSIDTVINNENSNDVIVIRDFNLGFIDWRADSTCTHLTPLSYNVSLGKPLIDFMLSNNLAQFNCVKNSDGRLLVLVFSNVSNTYVTEPLCSLSKTYQIHSTILVNLPYDNNVKHLVSKPMDKYNFYNTDYEAVVQYLRMLTAIFLPLFRCQSCGKRVLHNFKKTYLHTCII